MKRKRFSEAQIAFALRQKESGTSISDFVREDGNCRAPGDRTPIEFAKISCQARLARTLQDQHSNWTKVGYKVSCDPLWRSTARIDLSRAVFYHVRTSCTSKAIQKTICHSF